MNYCPFQGEGDTLIHLTVQKLEISAGSNEPLGSKMVWLWLAIYISSSRKLVIFTCRIKTLRFFFRLYGEFRCFVHCLTPSVFSSGFSNQTFAASNLVLDGRVVAYFLYTISLPLGGHLSCRTQWWILSKICLLIRARSMFMKFVTYFGGIGALQTCVNI